jgi:hypothetical protein
MSMMHSSESSRTPGFLKRIRLASGSRFGRLALIGFHIVVCCYSLAKVADWQSYMLYDGALLHYAIAAVLGFSLVSLLFVFAGFSFGYFVGFALYSMLLGFIWLNSFSKFNYDHWLAGLSAAASGTLFLLPAICIHAPFKRTFELSPGAVEHLLKFILALAFGTIVVASFYNFRLVSIGQIYDFRNDLYFPAPIRYLTGIVTTVLLPFACAGYLALGRRRWAVVPFILLLLFYPITLSKFALFSAAWIVILLALSINFEVRVATILSVLLPMLLGVIAIAVHPNRLAQFYFGLVNIRMMATPSSAMDMYNDFFASHSLTWFCQISFLKLWVSCPYQEPLSIVMEKTYQLGNLNASLFATEGIASVGLYFAPLAALLCGLVVALGNRASAGLPPAFVLISAALLPQTFLNVPLTTSLLTHGAGLLFLLWYVMPRAMFDRKTETVAS